MDQQNFRSQYCKQEGLMPKKSTIGKEQKAQKFFLHVFQEHTPALYRSWMTRMGAALTFFDLYALSIGRFCSKN